MAEFLGLAGSKFKVRVSSIFRGPPPAPTPPSPPAIPYWCNSTIRFLTSSHYPFFTLVACTACLLQLKLNLTCFLQPNISSPLLSLQMKDRWESNINVWLPCMYSQKWICYFQNRMFCLPVPTLIYLWEINIFPVSVCLFCCREICRPILGKYKSLTVTWMWKLGLRLCNSQKRNT